MVFQESETVELKTIIVDEIKKEIVTFANCAGGKLNHIAFCGHPK